MPPLHKQQHTGPGGQGAEGRFLPAPHLVRLTGTMMTRVGAVGCWLLATASAAELGVARDSTELADLQAQLQQALDQQAQLNNQQEALTNSLTPLLSWANHMAPHDTGCDLDHYTSILTLCGADASATETTVAPELDPVVETDASCECMDSWVYKGRRFAGCQVTDQPPEMHFYHAPWCVVSSGCAGAHPGPWGAWDYCKDATNWTKSEHGVEDAGRREWFSQHVDPTHAPLDPWVMEPQALFTSKRFQMDSPVTAYCGDKTCQYALTRLLSRCDHTDDTVMQEVVGLLSTASTSCDNATVASPPPPPPGARTYSVVVMMHSGDEMDQSSVRDVMVTMLGCQEEDIRGFKPTGVKGTYSFVLVTYVLNKDTINSLLEPVGDVAVTTMYGSDMSSEEMGDGGPARSAPGQGPNPADPGFNFFLMFGISTIGTLAAFAFCGTIGKVRKLTAPQEFELYGEPLLKHRRYEQPLTPEYHAEDGGEDPLAWLPPYNGDEQGPYGWEPSDGQDWESPEGPYTESDNDDPFYDSQYFLGAHTPPQPDQARSTGTMASYAGACDAFSEQNALRGYGLGARAQGSNQMDSDSESVQTDVTPEAFAALAQPVQAQPVEAQYVVPTYTSAEAQRVAMLERQLAEAQAQLHAYDRPGVRTVTGTALLPQQAQRERGHQEKRLRRPEADPWMQASLPEFLQMDGPTAAAFHAAIPAVPRVPPEPASPPQRVSHASAGNLEGRSDSHPYRCNFPGCTYAAAQRRYLAEHARVHSGVRPYRCPWEGCDYASSGSGHMSRHMRIHTGERPFKCSQPGCGYDTSQSGHLRTHMRTHTGERPYECPVEGCDYAASRSGHIARHMKVHDQGGRRRRGRPKKSDTSSAPAAAAGRSAGAEAMVPYAGAAAAGGGSEHPRTPPPQMGANPKA